jgi:hypothetical protein
MLMAARIWANGKRQKEYGLHGNQKTTIPFVATGLFLVLLAPDRVLAQDHQKEHPMNNPLSSRTGQASAEQRLHDDNIELPVLATWYIRSEMKRKSPLPTALADHISRFRKCSSNGKSSQEVDFHDEKVHNL